MPDEIKSNKPSEISGEVSRIEDYLSTAEGRLDGLESNLSSVLLPDRPKEEKDSEESKVQTPLGKNLESVSSRLQRLGSRLSDIHERIAL